MRAKEMQLQGGEVDWKAAERTSGDSHCVDT